MAHKKRSLAVIGGGIAGLGAAWLLDEHYELTLYEADAELGGNAQTVDVATSRGPVPVDLGVIFTNTWTYPNFAALLELPIFIPVSIPIRTWNHLLIFWFLCICELRCHSIYT